MRARRAWAGVAAAGLLAGLGIVGAEPAAAVPSAGCALLNGNSGSGLGEVAWASSAFNAGERLTVTWSALSVLGATVQLQVPGGVVVDSRVGAGTVAYVFPADVVASGNSALGGIATGTWSITCGVPGLTSDSTSGSASSGAQIPAWIQAYGRASKDATCLDGWDTSWQSWAEPVTGGWVCTRSIPSLG